MSEARAREIVEAWETAHWRCHAVRDLAGGYPEVRSALIAKFAAALDAAPPARPAGDARHDCTCLGACRCRERAEREG